MPFLYFNLLIVRMFIDTDHAKLYSTRAISFIAIDIGNRHSVRFVIRNNFNGIFHVL